MSAEVKGPVKFILTGTSMVGKTAILRRLIDHKFVSTVPTIGAEYDTLLMDIDSSKVRLQIWDTAGQEKYSSISKSYYRNAMGVLLVFDLTNIGSFEKLNIWINDIRNLCDPNVVVFLVGNKCDLVDQRQIPLDQAENFAKSQGIKYIETSAFDGTNINEVFMRAANDIIRKMQAPENTNLISNILPVGKNSKCC